MSNIMHTAIAEYISDLDRQYQTGTATEHTHRPALHKLLAHLMPELTVTNEPKRIECGAPDYIITDNIMPVGYVEAKDIGTDLKRKAHKAQFDRYLQALDNLIITDYLTFKWYLYGELRQEVVLGKRKDKKIVAESSNVKEFQNLIRSFSVSRSRGIKDTEQLAKVLANKAKLLSNNIERSLDSDEKTGQGSIVHKHLQNFRQVLLRGMKTKEFSDMYAQTIAYGMFAAWLNDKPGETFTRGKAELLIPHSNPFLRKFFRDIADNELDVRINWVVDALADSFNFTDRSTIDEEFDQKDHDPIIHFYETFLAEYNPALRKSRGVWYTPQPAVRFIVQAVDDLLKQEFGIAQGLADASDRVQILDPALGTGNFLAETIRYTYEHFRSQQGMWQSYVSNHLLPRLNGFEILMAPYAMAHLKLGMLLRQTGYKAPARERLRIYLTNSLEEAFDKTQFLTFDWLSDEASEASRIKLEVPIMVVMGNPPYSGESQNSDAWMDGLMLDYKKEPSGKKLQERNSKWINDDYVKFIRLGQDYIKRNPAGMGILAFINNHSFLDNPTFRGMRWELLQAFDKIYILDLHGNSRKKETAPDGSKDENIFDIQQGVSINIYIKTGQKKENELAKVFQGDLYGRRKEKFVFLRKERLRTVKWKELKLIAPQYFFIARDFSLQEEYEKGFSVQELFPVNSVGIVTARDQFTIHATAKAVKDTINKFIEMDVETARYQFELGRDARDWSVAGAKKDLTSSPDFNKIVPINYRPFDIRYTYYTGKSKGFHCMPRGNVMQHFLNGNNMGLVHERIVSNKNTVYRDVFISNTISDAHNIGSASYIFPLYLYPTSDKLLEHEKRKPNLNTTIVGEICQRTELRFTNEKEQVPETFAPIDLLDYIYAVLHSPTYRQRYKEFLKIDFPRVPYPDNAKKFWKLVQLGSKLRRLHLMEGVETLSDLANFPIAGTNEVETLKYVDGKVRINDTQYFDNVPSEAWNFCIGGYQPAQKWLKDRKGWRLEFEHIQHYQKIIRILKETMEVMDEIDTV